MYYFDDDTQIGISETLKKCAMLEFEQITSKGNAARQFIIREKNHVSQAKKIIDLDK